MSELTYHLKDISSASMYHFLSDELHGEDELSLMYKFFHSSLETQRSFLLNMLNEQYGGKKLTPPRYFAIDTENQSGLRSFTPDVVAEYLTLTATEKEIHQNILENPESTTRPLLHPLAGFEIRNDEYNSFRFWGVKTMAYTNTGNDYFMKGVGADKEDISGMAFLPQELPLEQHITTLYNNLDTDPFDNLYVFPNQLSEQERSFYREGRVDIALGAGNHTLHTCYTFRSSFGLKRQELQFKHMVVPAEKLLQHPDYHLFKLFWPIFDWEQLETRAFLPSSMPMSL